MRYWALIGGAGFIGQALQKNLSNLTLGECYGVYSLRKYKNKEELSNRIVVDASKFGYQEKINAVLLSAAGVYKPMSEADFRFNSIVVPDLATLLTQIDGAKVLVLGSSFEYGLQESVQNLLSPCFSSLNPKEDYGKSKKIGFERLFTRGRTLANLAYARVFQVWSENEHSTRLTSALQANSALSKITNLNSGQAVRDFVHVEDVAIEIINRFREWSAYEPVTNISTGIPTTVLEFAERFLASLGQSPDLVADIKCESGLYPRLVGEPHRLSKIPSLSLRI